MRKKLYKKLILIFCLAALTIATMVACINSDMPPIKPTSWEKYLDEVAKYLGNTIINAGEDFTVDIEGQIDYYDGTKLRNFQFQVKADIDLADSNADNTLVIELIGDTYAMGRQKVFGFYADNDKIYFQIFEEWYNKQSKFIFTNANIFSLFARSADINIIEMRNNFIDFGKNYFTNCVIDKNKESYAFNFDVGRYFENKNPDVLSTVFKLMPEDIKNSFFRIFDSNGFDEFYNNLGNLKGILTFKISDGFIAGIGLSDMDIDTEINSIGGINVVTDRLKIGDFDIENIKSYIPYDDTDFVETSIGTFTLSGSFSLINRTSNNVMAKYDIEINSKLDLLAIMVNDGDFSVLPQDNYFHLRITHKCDSKCSTYCSVEDGNKYITSKGAVLDIAFSPESFGTHNIYISVSLKSLLGENTVKNLIGNDAGLLSILFGNYTLLTLDSSYLKNAFNNPTADNSGGDLNKNLFDSLFNLLIKAEYDGNSATIEADRLLEILDLENDDVNNIIKKELSRYNIGGIRLDWTPIQYARTVNYDIYKATMHIIDYNDGETKDYYSLLGNIDPSLKWDLFDYTSISNNGDNKILYNIYDKNMNLVSGSGVSISKDELINNNGLFLKYRYTDIYKQEKTTEEITEIYDIGGIDYNNTEDYQNIVLHIAMPSKWLSKLIPDDIKQSLNKLFTVEVPCSIKLTDLDKNNTKIERTDKDGDKEKIEYRLQKSWTGIHPMLPANVTYKYSDGSTKSILIYGECDAIVINRESNISSNSYIFDRYGDVDIIYRFAGMSHIKNIKITEPDLIDIKSTGADKDYTIEVNKAFSIVLLNKYSVEVKYGDTSINIGIAPSFFYIDNKPVIHGGDTWYTSYSSTGTVQLIFQLVKSFSLEMRIYGKSEFCALNVVSGNIPSTTYKIEKSSSNNTYFTDYEYYNSYKISNASYGSGGLENQEFSIKVYRGYTSSGSIRYPSNPTPGEGVYRLTSLRFKGQDINQGDLINLPDIIFDPYQISYRILFSMAGYYKITIKVGNTVYNDYIIVNNSVEQTTYSFVESGSTELNANVGDVLCIKQTVMILNEGETGKSGRFDVNGNLNIYEAVGITLSDGNNTINIESGDYLDFGNSSDVTYFIEINIMITDVGELELTVDLSDIGRIKYKITVT